MNIINSELSSINIKNTILFIGAGMSCIAGCNTWDKLIENFIKKISSETNKDFNKRLDNGEIIQYCYDKLHKENNQKTIISIIRDSIIPDVEDAFPNIYLPTMRLITSIFSDSKVITTNFDNCIEMSKLFDNSNVFYEISDIGNFKIKSKCIFHIHGCIENIEKVIITNSQYSDLYNKKEYTDFLIDIFSNYSVLFLGYSLQDQKIRELLQKSKNINKHFCLIPNEDEFSDFDCKIFDEQYNTKIIIYGKREDFPLFIKKWAENIVRRIPAGDYLSHSSGVIKSRDI